MRTPRLALTIAALALASCADRLPTTEGAASPTPRSAVIDVGDADARALLDAARNQPIEGRIQLVIMTDKPLYQPGEDIRFRVDARHALGRRPVPSSTLQVELLDARDQRVGRLETQIRFGVASGALPTAKEAAGGTYKLTVSAGGASRTRELTVGTYRADKLKKSLEFRRRGYAAGETVVADLELSRATGEPLKNKRVSAQLLLGDTANDVVTTTTDKNGRATVRIELPSTLADKPNLAVTAHDGGTIEAIVRPVPVALGAPRLTLRPEGGALVAGLKSRVYFKAVDDFGDPVDVAGRVFEDDRVLASFESIRDGYGVFELSPLSKRRYRVEVTSPKAATASLTVHREGCTLRPLDRAGAGGSEIHLRARCNRARKLLVHAHRSDRRESKAGAIRVRKNEALDVTIPSADALDGLVTVTLETPEGQIAASRTLFRGTERAMQVSIVPEVDSVAPGSALSLTLETRDADGTPTPASLGVAVVDDAILAMADDKEPGLFAQLFLADINLERIPDPNDYFSGKLDDAAALDALVAVERWSPVSELRTDRGTASLSGRVLDENGNPLAGVTVVATSRVLQGSRSAISSADGTYKLVKLPDGRYTLTLYYADSTVRHDAVRVSAGRTARLESRFDTSRMSEVIVIVDTAPTIDPTPTKTGITLGEDYTRNIPVPGRTFEAVIESAAGSSGDALGVSFSGSSSLENEYVVDGVNATGLSRGRSDGERPLAATRTRFVETVYWHPHVRTNARGRATIEVEVGDSITSYRAIAQGFSTSGFAGLGEGTFAAVKPLSIESVIASHARRGDVIDHAVTVVNRTGEKRKATVVIRARGLELENPAPRVIELDAGERRTLRARARASRIGRASLDLAVSAGALRDRMRRTIEVLPPGYPQAASISGTLSRRQTRTLTLPEHGTLEGATSAELVILPSMVSQMTAGTDSILREPSGCFEQTSSSSYPNLMAVKLLRAAGASDAKFLERAMPMLERGYKRLVGFESSGGGFEWFGGDPGHEALTAYGLLQFHDMKAVYDGVDRGMLRRTVKWLLSRRDGRGGFKLSQHGTDSIGGAAANTASAYITWALAETGHGHRVGRELRALQTRALKSGDSYIIALALAATSASDGNELMTAKLGARLAGLQAETGELTGAVDSITRSGGESLVVEATALAAYALMRAGVQQDHAHRAIEWLGTKRQGGRWASTQATVLALKAIAFYGEKASKNGRVTIRVNGSKARSLRFRAKSSRALRITGLGRFLHPGKNTVEIESSGRVPFSFDASYRVADAPSSKKAPVTVTTRLARTHLAAGDATTLRATIVNHTRERTPMVLVRVGVPTGMKVEPKQLESLKNTGRVDFIETRPQEVTLYFRGLDSGAARRVDIALVASAAGTVKGPPSSSALYYTPEAVHWAAPLSATISP